MGSGSETLRAACSCSLRGTSNVPMKEVLRLSWLSAAGFFFFEGYQFRLMFSPRCKFSEKTANLTTGDGLFLYIGHQPPYL